MTIRVNIPTSDGEKIVIVPHSAASASIEIGIFTSLVSWMKATIRLVPWQRIATAAAAVRKEPSRPPRIKEAREECMQS